jgi:outer membrane biosynthesis protein TonB
MKAGLTTSAILHAVVLGFGLFTLSAPRAFDVADVEAFPVDIVPVQSITQIQQGDKKSPLKEKSAPIPTKKPDIVPDAKKAGDAAVDTDKPPTPVEKPKPVETAAAPAPAPEPTAKPLDDSKKAPEKKAETKPADAPATEMTPDPQPKQEVKPDPVTASIVAETPDGESVKLPDAAPTPEARPKPPEAQTAKAPDRKDTEKPQETAANRPKSDEKEFNADEVAALLNKEKAAGGGAKRSTDEASLGGEKTTSGQKLTQNEMDALRGQVQRCWNIPAGALDAENLKVSIKFKLDRAGAIEGSPEIIEGGGTSGVELAAAEAARRAVSRCAPYNLPADKYEAWADVIVHFDPSEMF